jgi:hypothetical protein
MRDGTEWIDGFVVPTDWLSTQLHTRTHAGPHAVLQEVWRRHECCQDVEDLAKQVASVEQEARIPVLSSQSVYRQGHI